MTINLIGLNDNQVVRQGSVLSLLLFNNLIDRIAVIVDKGKSNVWILIRGCIKKLLDWDNNEINDNKHSLRSNKKGYGGKTY